MDISLWPAPTLGKQENNAADIDGGTGNGEGRGRQEAKGRREPPSIIPHSLSLHKCQESEAFAAAVFTLGVSLAHKGVTT